MDKNFLAEFLLSHTLYIIAKLCLIKLSHLHYYKVQYWVKKAHSCGLNCV